MKKLILALLAIAIPSLSSASVVGAFSALQQTYNMADTRNWSAISSGIICTQEATPASAISGATTSLSYTTHMQFVGVGNYVRFVFAFSAASGNYGEVSLSNAVTLKASVQATSGSTPTQLTFGGATSVTKTYAVVTSDYVYLPYTDGSWCYVTTNLSVANSSLLVPGGWKGISDPNRENRGWGEGCKAGDLTATGQSGVGSTATTGDRMYGPLCALGYYPYGTQPPQSFLLMGDSHMAATNDPSCFGRGIGSYGVRACTQQFGGNADLTISQRAAFILVAKGGEATSEFLSHSSVVRQWARDYVTDVMLPCSNHDNENGADTTAWKQVMLDATAWAARGRRVKRIWTFPAFPKATSDPLDGGDNFATASGQKDVGGSTRNTVNSWIMGTSSTDYAAQAAPRLLGGQAVMPVNILSQFEVNSSNALTFNGGRFLVGDLTADYTGTVANLNNLSTTSIRATIPSVPALGVLQGYTIRFDSTTATVALRNQTRNIEFDTTPSDGTRRLVFSPALTTTPAVGDTFSLYAQADGAYKGIPTDTGIHLLKWGHAKIAKYLDSIGMFQKRNIAVKNGAVAPAIPFDPTTYGTPARVYDFSDSGTLYTDTLKTTFVSTLDSSRVATAVGSTIGGTKYGADMVQGTAGKQPLWATGPNGYGCVKFDASSATPRNDFLKDATTTLLSQPITRIALVRIDATPAATGYLWDTGTAGSTSRHRLTVTSVGARQASAGTTVGAGSWTNGTWVVVAVVYNTNTSQIYVNGSRIATNVDLGAQQSSGLIFGGDRTSAAGIASGQLSFSMTYYLSYNSAISDANVIAISNGISQKFGGIY